MPDLWEVLEYDQIAASVAEVLQVGDKMSVVEGPPGVGKSWLAKDIGSMWEESGGSTVLAEGDYLRADAFMFPFAFAMAGLPSGWKAVGPAVASMGRAGETLLGTAGLITATVEAVIKARGARRRDRNLLLGDTEQAILYELERLAKKRPLLFIADNLHWWDGGSLEFLSRLCDPRLWDAFPFLAELRIVATQTPEPYQSISNPAAHEALLVPSKTARFRLERVSPDRFEDVLVTLGANSPLPDGVSELVYSFSGGHLALASRCAERIANGESAVFLAATNDEDFLEALLTERVSSLGALGKQAVAMLQVAAILGLTFRREEVCCASETKEAETLRLLRHCRSEGFLEVADGLDRFAHDLYRQHFLSLGSEDRVGVHEALSNCLRLSRPAEYELRCLNAIDAERPAEAAALAIHAALQGEREGRHWRNLPPAILEAIEDGGVLEVAELLASALRCAKEYRFDDCTSTLDRLPRRLSRSLAGEADYLRAMCTMSTRSEQDRAKGRMILESWDGYVEEEPELGMRMMLLLLYGFFHVADKQPGWSLEARITHLLSARASFDPAAEDALYTLDRCAGGLHPADASLVRIREAADHFGPREGRHVLRRPVEYYRCKVNLAAKLIENGIYDEAHEVSREIAEFIDGYAPGVFTRLDFPCMNALQAEYRLGLVNAETAVARQREIAVEHRFEDDPYYVDNALAVYLALSGRHDEALELLDRLDAELMRSRTDPEPSMIYQIRANRCAIRLLDGDREGLQSEWLALALVAKESNYPDSPVLLTRHELLTEVLAKGHEMTATEFDQVLLERFPERLGPLWQHFGHGFVLPAVELWREN